MTQTTIIITPEAKEQIRLTRDYIRTKLNNKPAANNWLAEIETAINGLAIFPEAYPELAREPWKSKGIRKRVVGAFNLYYKFDKINSMISILAVIYGKRDQLRQLINNVSKVKDIK